MSGHDVTLQELERDDWGDPPEGATNLVRAVHALRRKPLTEFTVEDLRLAIGQQVGVDVLTPLALARLDADPYTHGHLYPGDLLVAVMALPRTYWSAHASEAARMAAIAARAADALECVDAAGLRAHLADLLAAGPWRAL